MKTCYECGSQAEKLYWKSRCPACITRRLETNLSENDKLRAALAAAKAKIKQLETPTHFFADDGDCTSEAVEAAIESSVSSWGAEGCGFVEVGCLRELPARLYKVWYEDDLLKFELCEGE
jgi:hypothetical protein